MGLYKDATGQLVVAASLPPGGASVSGPASGSLIDVAPWLRALDAPSNATWHPANYYNSGAEVVEYVAGVPATVVAAAAVNFNASNDRNSAAIAAPTIASDGGAVDHALQSNGTADISFEWSWSGNEGDIDGFQVFIYQSASLSAYTFGTSPDAETVYIVPANKRAFILYGVAPDLYYTPGVRAYRKVDKDIAVSGVILSLLVKPTLAAENPYRPSTNAAFGGDITGTIAGIPASAVNDWTAITNKPSFVDTFDSPASISSWQNYAGSGELSVYPASEAWYGGNVLGIGNNSGNDMAWLIHKNNIPFDPGLLYRIRCRVKRVSGTGTFYCGVAGVAADGVTLVASNGSAGSSSQHYVAASGVTPAQGESTEYIGYVKGVAATGQAGTNPPLSSPLKLHQNVRYIRPMIIANYSAAAGKYEVDMVQVDVLTEGMVWGGIVGPGRPEDGATVGATWGVNVNDIPYDMIYANDDSVALGVNPVLAKWTDPSSPPDGWGRNGTFTLSRETTIKRIGSYAAKCVTNATTSYKYLTRLIDLSATPLPAGTFLSGTFDIYVDSVTGTGKPGVKIRLYTNSALSAFVDTDVAASISTLDIWQRLPFTARVNAGQLIYGMRLYFMAAANSEGAFGGSFNGTVIFDNIRFALFDSSVDNTTIQINSNGSLSGGGGGQVTITGLGYTGDLNATNGANWNSNVSNKPTTLAQINGTEGSKLSGIANGATSNSILAGSGAPSGAVGINGDFYIDTAASVTYYKRSNAWSRAVPQFTSGNISTFFANAAIGSLQLGNGVIQTVHVGNAQIDTLKVAGGAITAAESVTNNNSYVLTGINSSNDATTNFPNLLSITPVTVDVATKRLILVQFTLSHWDSTPGWISMSLNAGGTVVETIVMDVSDRLTAGSNVSSYSAQFEHTPGGGVSVTYYIELNLHNATTQKWADSSTPTLLKRKMFVWTGKR
jgi:hypothetical protein